MLAEFLPYSVCIFQIRVSCRLPSKIPSSCQPLRQGFKHQQEHGHRAKPWRCSKNKSILRFRICIDRAVCCQIMGAGILCSWFESLPAEISAGYIASAMVEFRLLKLRTGREISEKELKFRLLESHESHVRVVMH